MIGLDEFEVITKLFPCDFFIIILIVCKLKKCLKVDKTNFGNSKPEESQNKKKKLIGFEHITFLDSV